MEGAACRKLTGIRFQGMDFRPLLSSRAISMSMVARVLLRIQQIREMQFARPASHSAFHW
jgi:hypothetical protein